MNNENCLIHCALTESVSSHDSLKDLCVCKFVALNLKRLSQLLAVGVNMIDV